MNSADEAAGVDVGSVGDGAGVEDDEIGRRGVAHGLITVVGQGGFDGCAVGLGGTAAEALHEDCLHFYIVITPRMAPRHFQLGVSGILGCACAVGQPLEELGNRGIERKVRSSKGGMPANGRGFALKAHATDSATENVPLAASAVSKGEKVR
jgi:hypothetical protein